MAVLSLSVVSAGVYAALNVAAMTALATGGISDGYVPQAATFPRLWFTVNEEHSGGFGAGHGPAQVNLRVHAASQYEGDKELYSLLDKAKELLKDQPLTLTGWQMCGRIFYLDTVEPFDSVIGGVRCREAAMNFYFFVEPTS